MKDGREFVTVWVVNSLLLYFIPYITTLVVIGNARLTPFMASIMGGFLLTLLDGATQPAFASLQIKLKDDWYWLLAHLFVNVLGIWVIARYADLTGVGISSAWMAVLLGIVYTLVHWGLKTFVLSAAGRK